MLEEKDAFEVAGLMTLVRGDQAVTTELWDVFAQQLERLEDAIGPRDYYGIAWYPRNWPGRGFLYMAATGIQGLDAAHTALVVKAIQALKWARFIHKGPTRDLPLTLDYVYHTWLPKSGKSLAYPLVVEHYGEDFRGLDDGESERVIYVPIE